MKRGKHHQKPLQRFVKEMDTLEKRLGNRTERNALTTKDKMHFDLTMAGVPPWFRRLAETCSDIIGEDPFVPKVNSYYSGGALASCSLPPNCDDIGIIAYPSGSELERLTLANVSSSSSCQGVAVRRQSDIRLDGDGPIYQVELDTTQDETYGVVRQKGTTHLLHLPSARRDLTFEVVHSEAWSEEDGMPTHVCLSPYIPGEYCVATSNGCVYRGAKDKLELVCSNIEPRFSCAEDWLSADWGIHPRQISVTDRTAVDVYDLRTRDRGSALFSLPHSVLHTSERIMASTSHATNRFYHLIATDYSLMLVDQRFSHHPVLFWSHSHLGRPAYLKSVAMPHSMPDVVLLGSQDNPEVHAFQMSLADGETPSQAIGKSAYGLTVEVFE